MSTFVLVGFPSAALLKSSFKRSTADQRDPPPSQITPVVDTPLAGQHAHHTGSGALGVAVNSLRNPAAYGKLRAAFKVLSESHQSAR